MTSKHISDVSMHVTLSKLQSSNKNIVAILTSGNEDTDKYNLFNSLDEVSSVFDENTSVYNLVEKAFDTEGFTGQVEVISAPKADVQTKNGVTAQANSKGAEVTADTTNRFVYALSQHLYDGFLYVVADGIEESDLEAISDYLYKNQRASLVVQLDSVDKLETLSNYSSKNQVRSKSSFNTVLAIVETGDYFPAIQVAAYATANAPVDIMHVGNLSEFNPTDLSMEEIQRVKGLQGSLVVNKADDYMMLQGKSLGDNYIDQFINARVVIDRYEYSAQRQLNQFKQNRFDDNTINLIYMTIKNIDTDLYNQGYLNQPSSIDKKSLAETDNNDIALRRYKGISINAQVATSIDYLDIHVNVLA